MNAYDDDGYEEWLDRVNAEIREIAPDIDLSDFCGDAVQRGMFLDGLDPDGVIAELRGFDVDFNAICQHADDELADDNDAAYAYDGDGR